MWSYWPRLKAMYFTIKLDGLHGHQYHSFSFKGVEKISLIFNIFFQYGHIGPAIRPIYPLFWNNKFDNLGGERRGQFHAFSFLKYL